MDRTFDIDTWETEETIEPGLFAHDGKKATRYHAKCTYYLCPHIRTAQVASWSKRYRDLWFTNHARLHVALNPPAPITEDPNRLT